MYGEGVVLRGAGGLFRREVGEAVRLAEAFVRRYPQSGHLGEMYRVLGNANYRLGYANRALTYYEKYMATTDKPLRSDAYFMGLAYIDAGKYADAIRMLQLAVGPADKLTQHAQLQLGQLYLRQGDKQQAQFAFEAASREDFDPKVTETALYNYALLVRDEHVGLRRVDWLREVPDVSSSPYAERLVQYFGKTFSRPRITSGAGAIAVPIRMTYLEAKQWFFFNWAHSSLSATLNEAFACLRRVSVWETRCRGAQQCVFLAGESYYRMEITERRGGFKVL